MVSAWYLCPSEVLRIKVACGQTVEPAKRYGLRKLIKTLHSKSDTENEQKMKKKNLKVLSVWFVLKHILNDDAYKIFFFK